MFSILGTQKGAQILQLSPGAGNFSYAPALDEYRSHLADNHKLKIEGKEILTFSIREEFEKWLFEEEQSTNTHFVKPRGERRYNSHSVIVYVCNRSGTFKSDGLGKRQLKAQGTSKIGYHCPASINVKILSRI